MMGSAIAPITSKNDNAVFPDANTTFRLKLIFYGQSNSGVERLDSLITDDISVWEGPKTPISSLNLTIVKAEYTLSAVRFY